jgi:hypothetical protein
MFFDLVTKRYEKKGLLLKVALCIKKY